MNTLTAHLRTWAIVAIGASLLVGAMGLGAARSGRTAVLAPESNEFLFSATQIVRLPGGNVNTDSDIARLDTKTGAIYRFRGNVDNASTQPTWELRVPGVGQPTSGLLEVQNILPRDPVDPAGLPFGTFYIDTLTGETVRQVETPATQVKSVGRAAEAYELDQPVTFLVDIVYGTTWILRERASSNASWQLVDIFKKSSG